MLKKEILLLTKISLLDKPKVLLTVFYIDVEINFQIVAEIRGYGRKIFWPKDYDMSLPLASCITAISAFTSFNVFSNCFRQRSTSAALKIQIKSY